MKYVDDKCGVIEKNTCSRVFMNFILWIFASWFLARMHICCYLDARIVFWMVSAQKRAAWFLPLVGRLVIVASSEASILPSMISQWPSDQLPSWTLLILADQGSRPLMISRDLDQGAGDFNVDRGSLSLWSPDHYQDDRRQESVWQGEQDQVKVAACFSTTSKSTCKAMSVRCFSWVRKISKAKGLW